MLPSFNLPGKNIPQDKQMAMMRTYLSQLKDDTETELYDIKWDNLSKSLKEKIEALDKVAQTALEDGQYIAQNIAANYIKADEVEAAMISAGFITANVLTTQYLTANYINALNITAAAVVSDWVYAGAITASQITSGRISANYLDSNVIVASELTTDLIVSKFIASNTAIFNRLNVGMDSSTATGLRLYAGNTYADVYCEATSTPNHYHLVVDLPS